jgi:hypothetical protein
MLHGGLVIVRNYKASTPRAKIAPANGKASPAAVSPVSAVKGKWWNIAETKPLPDMERNMAGVWLVSAIIVGSYKPLELIFSPRVFPILPILDGRFIPRVSIVYHPSSRAFYFVVTISKIILAFAFD